MKKIEVWLIQHIGYVPTFILRCIWIALCIGFVLLIVYGVGYLDRPAPYISQRGNFIDGMTLFFARMVFGFAYMFMATVICWMLYATIQFFWMQFKETYPPQKDKE